MNTENETIVSAEMLKKLRAEGLDAGYIAVPAELQAKASKLLRGRDLASMNADMKRRLRNLRKRKRRAGVPGY